MAVETLVTCTNIDNLSQECTNVDDHFSPRTTDTPSFTPFTLKLCFFIQVAGDKQLIKEGIRVVKHGGSYILVGLVHPNSELGITAEQIIRKCLTVRGNYKKGKSRELKMGIKYS